MMVDQPRLHQQPYAMALRLRMMLSCAMVHCQRHVVLRHQSCTDLPVLQEEVARLSGSVNPVLGQHPLLLYHVDGQQLHTS